MSAAHAMTQNDTPRRITNWRDAAGMTIRTVIEDPGDDLTSPCAAVVVFEGDCWMTLHAETDPYQDDEARLGIGGEFGTRNTESFLDYLTPDEALEAYLINPSQRVLAEAQRDARREQGKASQIAALREKLAALEKIREARP